jgi:hypothetical protein
MTYNAPMLNIVGSAKNLVRDKVSQTVWNECIADSVFVGESDLPELW